MARTCGGTWASWCKRQLRGYSDCVRERRKGLVVGMQLRGFRVGADLITVVLFCDALIVILRRWVESALEKVLEGRVVMGTAGHGEKDGVKRTWYFNDSAASILAIQCHQTYSTKHIVMTIAACSAESPTGCQDQGAARGG